MRTRTGAVVIAMAVTMSGAGCAASLGYNRETGPPGFEVECAAYREACVEVCRPFAVRHFGCHISAAEGLVVDCDCMGKEDDEQEMLELPALDVDPASMCRQRGRPLPSGRGLWPFRSPAASLPQ